MEKAVVFGPLIVFFGFSLLLIVAFIGFIVRLILKSKNEDWYGEVIDKKANTYKDFDTDEEKNSYYLVVKMKQGRDRNISLSRDIWENFSVGDQIHKPKGKLFPEKV